MQAGNVVLLVMVGLAAIVDLRTRRIPNALTFGGAAAALVYHAFTSGPRGLGLSAAGWAVGVALFLPMFLLRGMGGGDVKLLGAVGAWLGPTGALWGAFYSVMAGGLLALAVGAWHGYLGKAFRNLWVLLGFWRVAGVQQLPGLTLDDARGPRLPYGVAIAAGTAATVWLM
jgi:prepilin peptidase CpaA